MDIQKLRDSIKEFARVSRPSSLDFRAPCTVGDINFMIDKLQIVLSEIVDELEKDK